MLLSPSHTLSEYFNQTKWVMILDYSLYHEYLNGKLRRALESNLQLSEEHGEPHLLCLRDEDLLQILLEVIYSKCTLADIRVSQLSLSRLTASDNQQKLLQFYHVHS